MNVQAQRGAAGQLMLFGQGRIEVSQHESLISVVGGQGGEIILDLPRGAVGQRLHIEKKNDSLSPGIKLGRNGDHSFHWPQRQRFVILTYNGNEWSAHNA